MELSAAEVIRKEYWSSPNVMTPDVISYGWIVEDRIAYEVSTGSGFYGNRIFGLSVVSIDPATGRTSRHNRLSGCFQTVQDADCRSSRIAYLFEYAMRDSRGYRRDDWRESC